MNICKGFSWQDDWLVTIWDSKILLGCNRVVIRHCWFWAAIQILRFTEHSSYSHWLKEKTRENQNRKRNLFLFSPCLRKIKKIYLNKCFLSHFHLSLLSLCCLPVANIDPISIAVEDQSLRSTLMFKVTKESLPGSVALTLKVMFSLSVALHRHTESVETFLILLGCPIFLSCFLFAICDFRQNMFRQQIND